jgi:hypothetical protein
MESKSEGKYSREEKGGGSKDTPSDSLDPIVEDFVEFTSSNEYMAAIKEFYQENCHGFEDFEEFQASGAGNKLEWMDTYHRYMALVDEQLNEFCRSRRYDAADVFERIQATVTDNRYSEFTPLFLKSIEEGFFFEQMCACALQRDKERAAERAHDRSDGGSLSGVWILDTDRVDRDELNDWPAKAGAPWVFRKLFVMAHKKKFRCVVVHTAQNFSFSLNLPLLGSRSVTYILDGKWRPGTHDTVSSKAFMEDGAVITYVNRRVPGAENESRDPVLLVTRYELTPGGIKILRKMYLDGSEDHREDSRMSLHFNRE